MNASASECSGGCESGWTLYLEHSSLDQNASFRDHRFSGECEEGKVKEEDLSMVSDASSGPPHFPEEEAFFNEDNGCFYPPMSLKSEKLEKKGKKRQKVRENQHLLSLLDDTASSPVFDFSKNNIAVTHQQGSTESILDYSQGFSATYFEERSSFQDHFGYLQSQNELQIQNNQWFGRKRMGMR